jgi:hypothetical protein
MVARRCMKSSIGRPGSIRRGPRWLGGVALPIALAVYGAACIITQQGMIPGGGRGNWFSKVQHYLSVAGTAAISLGIVCIALAVLVHWAYYWRNYGRTVAMILLVISLLAVTAGCAYLVIHLLMFG